MDRLGIRVSILVPSLRCGGVERAVTTTVAELSQRGYDVTVLTYHDTRNDFFSLPPAVERVPLGLERAPAPVTRLVPRLVGTLRVLRRALIESRPHVVIAHMARCNVHALLALAGSGIPVIVTEHGDVSPTHWRKAFHYRLRRACYRSAFRVVSVSQAVDRNFGWIAPESRAIIANPIAVKPLPADVHLVVRDEIVSVGRLSHAKGFDILLDAFARIARKFPRWRLVIVGDGEERSKLERQVAHLQLGGRVLFTGALADPSAFLRRAKLCVMASRYEGFPLAHGEALACGLPVIATDCPSRPLTRHEHFVPGGVRELVLPGVNGVLVTRDNPGALARAMAALMADGRTRHQYAGRTQEVLERVTPERIADAWEQVIAQAIAHSATANPAADDSRPSVVITGPVSSAISGISTHVVLLAAALQDRWTLLHFPIGGEGLKESFMARGLRLFVAPLRLARLLRRRRPSLVHVNTSMCTRACIRDALVVATCLVCAQPFVLQFHGGRLPQSATRISRAVRRTLGRVLGLAEGVVAISREDETFYRAAASTTRVVRIPNGVAVSDVAASRPARFSAGQLRLLHFGRLAEDKGLLDILDALAILKQQGSLHRVSLVIAGTGPLLAAARQRVAHHGLEAAVRFVGAAFGAQKDQLMADADLFVFPTYHAERLPYALLETMAAGVVPITCNAGAIADVMQDGREGFLVKPRDPRGLADLLAALLQDPSALPRLSAASRQRIRESYSLERMANAFDALYSEVIPPAPLGTPVQIGASIDLASGVKSLGPASDMYQQSSMRTPNSPGM